MAIDTPARLAILGAGPLGLEAALYARFLGYDVEIFEQGRVGEHVRRWGHERMFAPFGWNRSTLGLAAIATHDETYAPPRDDLRLTGDEWLRQYVEPLAATDLLSDHIRERATVVRIARGGLLKTDLPGDPDRGDFPLRLLVKTEQGGERVVDADGVIDTTGVLSRPNFLGEAGLPALGELAARHQIEYGLPDVHGARRDDYAGRHTLVVGDGDSAATVVVNLARLAESSPTTKVTWVTRELLDDPADGPLARLDNDPLPARDELRAAANRLSRTNGGAIAHLPGTAVQSIARTDSSAPWTVGLIGQHAGELNCDRIVGCVGHRPDRELTSELQLVWDEATDVPAPPTSTTSPRLLAEIPAEFHSLLTSEPNYYVLGAKSAGRLGGFLFRDGLNQIRRLFALLGDRPTLDLYKNPPR